MFRRTGRSTLTPDVEVNRYQLSFGSWADLPEGTVVQVCHPHWRGVRSATYSFGSPVIECEDLRAWSEELTDRILARSVSCVVVQGWPPGAGHFVRALADSGVAVKCVLHSSPAQHGAEPSEAAVADEVLGLSRDGILSGVGMVKAGVAEGLAQRGFPVDHVPNRAPIGSEFERLDLGDGFHVGVFAEPIWRKNVVTQLLAVGLMGEAIAHVLRRPDVAYLDGLAISEHGVQAHDVFFALQASVDVNLYVTLSECHPFTPQESYMAGVPCLMSRTSAVFRDDPELWHLTTVDELDNPAAIARAGLELHRNRDEAVDRARAWIKSADLRAVEVWRLFTASS
jgi:hypothetical protein